MTFNPNYAELLGRELQRERMREADRERLIRSMTLAKPSGLTKVWLISRERWGDLWRRAFRPKRSCPAVPLPKNSPSL